MPQALAVSIASWRRLEENDTKIVGASIEDLFASFSRRGGLYEHPRGFNTTGENRSRGGWEDVSDGGDEEAFCPVGDELWEWGAVDGGFLGGGMGDVCRGFSGVEGDGGECGEGAFAVWEVYEVGAGGGCRGAAEVAGDGGVGGAGGDLFGCDGAGVLSARGYAGLVRCDGGEGALGGAGAVLGGGGGGVRGESGGVLFRFDQRTDFAGGQEAAVAFGEFVWRVRFFAVHRARSGRADAGGDCGGVDSRDDGGDSEAR